MCAHPDIRKGRQQRIEVRITDVPVGRYRLTVSFAEDFGHSRSGGCPSVEVLIPVAARSGAGVSGLWVRMEVPRPVLSPIHGSLQGRGRQARLILGDVAWSDNVEILREDDPRCDDLEGAGWRVVASSW